ncbi:type IV secretory system conjugative DNA transfer family protein [Streptomyces sp. 4N509B]|uniref:type IV secretory system conjugative DNA transfer family protein n=1 Tax=Streptomyces sp. 4N509B TaxID=3457413 RepID=UPI003FD08E58
MTPPPATPRTATRLRLGRDAVWVVPLVAAFLLTTALWLAAVLSGLLAHGRPATVSWQDTANAFLPVLSHPTAPASAWPPTDGVGGAAPFWSGFLLLLAAGITSARFVHRTWRRLRTDGGGTATAAQLKRSMGAEQALARAASLRPTLLKKDRLPPTLHHVAVNIGTAAPSKIPLWIPIEESVVLVAPPREGKTSQLILPGILGFQGTVLATSSKTDVLYGTALLRQKHGPVWVLDPAGLSGWPQQLRWPLTSGCERYQTARKRAEILVATTKTSEDTTNGGYFALNAMTLITCWLHAAALNDRPVADVLGWAADPDNREAVDLLACRDRHALAELLAGQHAAAPEERSASWRTAQQPFVALYDDRIADVFAPNPPDSFSIEQYLTHGGTLFLIGEDDDNSALAPLNAAFARTLFDTAKALAARAPNGRLPVPLGCFLDELANVAPLPEIPSLMSVSGSHNIFVMAVLQSYAQAEERWGTLGVRKMYAASTVKIFLGGISDPQELKAYSALTGEFDEDVQTVNADPVGNVSTSTALRRRPVLEPADIRMIPERGGLIIHRHTPATRVTFVRAHEGPYAQAIQDATRRAHYLIHQTDTHA